MSSRHMCVLLLVCLGLLGGCGVSQDKPTQGPYEVLRQNATVSATIGSSCSTSSVKGLTKQVFAELRCLKPNAIVSFKGLKGVSSSSSATYMYLQEPALNSLKKVLARRPGKTMRITSALRSLPQQYLLYQWFRRGRCRIPDAASPGRSNHETGIALDVSPHSSWVSHFKSQKWRWLGDDDPVHFDYKGSGTVNLSGLSVKAFQILWNRNNPKDKISVDGKYGSQTSSRLAKSPAGGFPKYGCAATWLNASLVSHSAKDLEKESKGDVYLLCPDQPFSFSITVENTGQTPWSDINKEEAGKAVRIGFLTGELFGGPDRVSINTTGTPEAKNKDQVTFTMQGTAPTLAGTYQTTWQMVSEKVKWFGPKITLTFKVPGVPEEPTCETGLEGTCGQGTLVCQRGAYTCVAPLVCREPVDEPLSEGSVADASFQEPTKEPPVFDAALEQPPTQDHAGVAPDGSGVVVLSPDVCSPSCKEGFVCQQGACVSTTKPASGCQCSPDGSSPGAPWLGIGLFVLLFSLIHRKEK